MNLRSLSGRETGKKLRSEFCLDEKDSDLEKHEIELPEVGSIHSSFFLGLIHKSIKDLGEEKFRDKYTFINSHKHIRSLELAITESQIKGANYEL